MASKSEFESLDEEVRELLQNYKFKKATVYQPCMNTNIKECLIGISEELELLNINYTFNPYFDFTTTLHPDSLVKLVNAFWALLHEHKTTAEKADTLVEENHVLGVQNKQLNSTVDKLKQEIINEKHEAKSCAAAARRVSDHSDEIVHSLAETKAKLAQLSKQKDTTEKSLRHEISRLKIENEKLSDRLRNKTGFTPCSDVCDSTVMQLKERDRGQQVLISKLQRNVQDLVKEVVAMKEKIIIHGLE
ncbi:uncharacterized protein LOC125241534 [Leguminivora glycinivorella]|uniref:uncharacterized protein LOC125241534 n=1 Tax=Leguminivora glycinivorella TaxID=1035111 RepID=UPI00200EDB17|nr:uncharacterized protein LOC125241534 [Leguminivora glycinivorella]